jgi:hypothetical protein
MYLETYTTDVKELIWHTNETVVVLQPCIKMHLHRCNVSYSLSQINLQHYAWHKVGLRDRAGKWTQSWTERQGREVDTKLDERQGREVDTKLDWETGQGSKPVKCFPVYKQGRDITHLPHSLTSLYFILVISFTCIIFATGLPLSLCGVDNSVVQAVNSTVHSFRAAVPCRQAIRGRTVQASGQLGNVNSTITTSRVTM